MPLIRVPEMTKIYWLGKSPFCSLQKSSSNPLQSKGLYCLENSLEVFQKKGKKTQYL